MSPEKTIIIANTAEAFKSQLLESGHTDEGQARIRHELALSQRAFFWAEDGKVVVTPYKIPKELFEFNSDLLSFYDVQNLSPHQTDLDLSAAITADLGLSEQISQLVKTNKVIFSPYALTPGLDSIFTDLREKGLDFDADVQDVVLTQYLDSKAGFREVVGQLSTGNPEVKIPEGYICQDQESAIERSLWFIRQGRSCVVKANMGESGWGLFIIDAKSTGDESVFSDELRARFNSDRIWADTTMVVEECIDIDKTVGGGSPSTEVFITDQGSQVTYTCGQLVNDAGEFFGVAVGPDVLEQNVQEQLERVGLAIGQKYHALGYRGYFDIDFVVSKSGVPYAVETNTRRTGGTHVYDLGRRLFGEDISIWGCLLSEDAFRYGSAVILAEEILKVSQELMFKPGVSTRGVVLTLINPSDPVLGYIAIGEDKNDAIALQKQFQNLWGQR